MQKIGPVQQADKQYASAVQWSLISEVLRRCAQKPEAQSLTLSQAIPQFAMLAT